MTPLDDLPESHMAVILGHEMRELRSALAARQTELRLITGDRDDLRSNALRLNAALDDTEARAAEQSLDLVRLAELVCNHETALDQLRIETAELERSLRDMTTRERRAATAERDALRRLADERARLDEARALLRRATARATQVARRVNDLEASLAQSRSRSAQLLTLLASVAGDLARQQTQWQSVRRSIWWKVGAPLRRVLRVIGIPDSRGRDTRARVVELNASRWFDGDWYLRNNPDVCAQQLDPAIHYLTHGTEEGRNPGPDFDTLFYMESNLDVTASGLNPLIHFIRHGEAEGRLPHPCMGASGRVPAEVEMTTP